MFRFSRTLLAQRYLTAMQFLRRFFSFSLRRKTSGARPDPLQPVRNVATALPARRAIWARPTLHQQQQSAFFTKLHPDIRHCIYREVLPDLHVASGDGRLLSRRCVEETWGAGGWNRLCWWANCLLRGSTAAPNPSTGRYEAEDESLFSESNIVFFAQNVPCFRQTRTIVDLQHTVLPQRWREIRSLHLTVLLELYLNNNGPQGGEGIYPVDVPLYWKNAWRAISAMTSLRNIRVSFSNKRPFHNRPDLDAVAYLLRSMVEIQVSNFVVEFVWLMELGDLERRVGTRLPFQVRITGDMQ